MKIALYQFNAHIGNFEGNLTKVICFLFFLFSFASCKKEKNIYTFSITTEVLNKKPFSFAKAFLYNDKGELVDEVEMINKQTVILNSPYEGKHNVAIFATNSPGTGESYQFDYFYDVPNNSIWKFDKAVYNNLIFDRELSSPRVIELSNVKIIDTIWRGGAFYNTSFSYNAALNKAYISGESDKINQIVYIKANKESNFRSFILPPYKQRNKKDTIRIDYSKLDFCNFQNIKFPSLESWYHILAAKKTDTLTNILTEFGSFFKPKDNFNQILPNTKFDKYYLYADNQDYEKSAVYYNQFKQVPTTFSLPNLDATLTQKGESTISYNGNSNAKGIIINGNEFVNPATFSWEIHAPCDLQGNSVIVLPQLPKSITKKYNSLKNYNYKVKTIVTGLTFVNDSNLNYYDYLEKKHNINNKIYFINNVQFFDWQYETGLVLIGKKLE